jgi:hypothetical protein
MMNWSNSQHVQVNPVDSFDITLEIFLIKLMQSDFKEPLLEKIMLTAKPQ